MLAQLLGHAILMILADKEPLEPLRRHIRGDRLRVTAEPCLGECVLVDIGRKDLDPRRRAQRLRMLDREHPERIRLFARRAAGDPDPDMVLGSFVREQSRDDLVR